MTYDPQAKGQRPSPKSGVSAPVDALLPDDAVESELQAVVAANSESSTNLGGGDLPPLVDDPISVPAVTPEPADPPPDKLLINGTLLAAVGVLVAALALRYLCKRSLRCRAVR